MHKTCLLGGAVLVLALFAAGCRSDANPYGADFQNTVTTAKNQVFPAVVYIKVIRDNLKAGKNVADTISGSGVVMSADGEVVTNHHVVDKATEIRCLLYDGRAYTAKLLGSDKDTDLALLKLQRPENDKPLPFAEFDYSGAVSDGDFVMAMGAPWGLNRSVSIGIVSCSRRYLAGQGEYTLWYQTDAAILPGNSGGPLVNTSGKVIGVNTLGMGTGALAFSIPAHTAQYVIARLRQYGDVNWAWLGLILQPLHDFDRNIYFDYPTGVVVSGTEPGSPARTAGIEAQDVIVAVGGEPVCVKTSEDMPAFRRFLGLLPFDKPVRFDLLRNGKPIQLEITPRAKGKVEGDTLDLPRWEFTARAINRFDNSDLYFYRPDGVFVYGVHYSGQASRAQLAPHDIILKVNGTEIHSLDDLKKAYDAALSNIDNKRKTLLTLMRNGSLRQTVIDFSTDFDKE